MAITNESHFWIRIKPQLEAIPDSCWFRVNDRGRRGIPDVWGFVNGHGVVLELKRSRSEAEKTYGRVALQKYNLAKINKCGGIAFLAYPENWKDVLNQIKLLGGKSEEKSSGGVISSGAV